MPRPCYRKALNERGRRKALNERGRRKEGVVVLVKEGGEGGGKEGMRWHQFHPFPLIGK
jgi:hypothetical protein